MSTTVGVSQCAYLCGTALLDDARWRPGTDSIYLASDKKSTADGNLKHYATAHPEFAELDFGFVIADEAHAVKRTTGSYYNMLRLFRWDRIMWVSGIPILNSLGDIVAPVSLI